MSFENYQRMKNKGLDMFDIQAAVPVCSITYCEESPTKDGLCLGCLKTRNKNPDFEELDEARIRDSIKKSFGEKKLWYQENLEMFLMSKKKIADNKDKPFIQKEISKHLLTYCTMTYTKPYKVNYDVMKKFKKDRAKMEVCELLEVLDCVKKKFPLERVEKKPLPKDGDSAPTRFVSAEIDFRYKNTVRSFDYSNECLFIDVKGVAVGIYVNPEGNISVLAKGHHITINDKENRVFVHKSHE